jgi:twitching motility protein PilT
MQMQELLKLAVESRASDLHITVGRPPILRISGQLVPMEFSPLNPEQTRQLAYSILTKEQREKFEKEMELDLSYTVAGLSRFRVNVYLQKDGVGMALRVIPTKIPINQERSCHIMTIEDPIEFVHIHNKSMVNQRELFANTLSFNNALRHLLRQDPDVVLVGEMRDLETIAAAITIAETGHLVFATLHTLDAAQTVDRMVDVFPPYQQQQIRTMLAGSLKGVICQQLLPRKDGKGRVAAREILVVTPAISNLIREGKSFQIYSAIQTGGALGMVTMDQSVNRLLKEGLISYEVAQAAVSDPQSLSRPSGKR